MKELVTMKTQEDFPRSDIDDDCADMLELLLQNKQTFDSSFAATESNSLLFKYGHLQLTAASEPYLLRHESELLSVGVKSYAVISGIAALSIKEFHNSMLIRPHLERAYLAINENFQGVTKDLPNLFRNHRPNTSRVVEAIAKRQHGNNVDYALTGAALAYRLESQALLYSEQIGAME